MSTMNAPRTAFAFARTRPQVAEHKDALLIEFAGFWMETEEGYKNTSSSSSDVVISPATPNPLAGTSPNTAMEIDDSVSVISIDDDEDEPVQQEQSFVRRPIEAPKVAAEQPREQVRSNFLSTCWDIDSFMDSMIPAEATMEA